jgi:hypothetical protein
MSNFEQREYYKIFGGTNQAQGYDNIHLGYSAKTTELEFKKDKLTYFHIPYFATTQSIHDSTLISDGAVPGSIPALADRIYKKLGNYGNTTPWGTQSEQSDGTWLCTWLYSPPNGTPIWLDRYYNPGRLAYDEALRGEANFTDYIKHDPIYYDVPSVLTFESGVLYKYFHQGEDTALQFVQTLAGDNKDRLKLDVENWSLSTVDSSIFKTPVIFESINPDWFKNVYTPGYRDRQALSFSNTDFINCYIPFNDNLNLTNEFSVTFWVYNDDWSLATNTQLAGNLYDTGFGVFYNNLNNNPFFVIPENTYGHLFYFNQEGKSFLDKNTQVVLGQPSNPIYTCINSNNEVIVLDNSLVSKRVYKFNTAGERIAFNRFFNGNLFQFTEEPKTAILGHEDQLTVFTTTSTYIFDKDLLLLSTIPGGVQTNEQVAFNTEGILVKQPSCLDLKIDQNNNKWHIGTNNKLYFNDIVFSNETLNNVICTNIAIDPDNNVWVLGNSNLILKIQTTDNTIVETFNIGVNTDLVKSKNISFIKTYHRNTNTFVWYALIYHDFEKTLYQITLDGKIYEATYLLPLLNIKDPATTNQDSKKLVYTGKGDFTGYEFRRIFNKLRFNNNPQIEFKIGTTPTNKLLPHSIYTLSVPVQYLTNKNWHLITATYKNFTLKLYVNNFLRDTLTIPNNTFLTYTQKNNLYVGTPAGKTLNYNNELLTTSVIWNGYIDSIKIYDYEIKPEFISLFIKEKTFIDDIVWNIPTSTLSYIEAVEKFFKHRLPGYKSGFFNLRISGSNITDNNVRALIEKEIKTITNQTKPVHTELLNIEWID